MKYLILLGLLFNPVFSNENIRFKVPKEHLGKKILMDGKDWGLSAIENRYFSVWSGVSQFRIEGSSWIKEYRVRNTIVFGENIIDFTKRNN